MIFVSSDASAEIQLLINGSIVSLVVHLGHYVMSCNKWSGNTGTNSKLLPPAGQSRGKDISNLLGEAGLTVSSEEEEDVKDEEEEEEGTKGKGKNMEPDEPKSSSKKKRKKYVPYIKPQ